MAPDLDTPPPCIVCGAEGGNCGPEGDHPHHVQFKEWGEDRPTPTSTRRPKEEPVPNAVVAAERIWEIVPVPRSRRTRKVLRFAPGAAIPPDEAKRLNVRQDGHQSKIPTAKPASTTSVPLADRKPSSTGAAFPRALEKKTRGRGRR